MNIQNGIVFVAFGRNLEQLSAVRAAKQDTSVFIRGYLDFELKVFHATSFQVI